MLTPAKATYKRKSYSKTIDQAVVASNPDEIIEPEIVSTPVADDTPFPPQRRVWQRFDGAKELRVQVYLPFDVGNAMAIVCAKLQIPQSAFMRKAVVNLLKQIKV